MHWFLKTAAVCALTFSASGTSVVVSNFSFESPEVPNTVPALPMFEAWQQTPKPAWYDEDPEDPRTAWQNLAGVFPNNASATPGYIENMDQKQAAFIFAIPSNGVIQDLTNRYEVAQSYTVTVGFVGSSALPPTDGTSLALSFFYREGGEVVTIASTSVVYNAANFPTNTQFIDFTATLPPVKALDAWAGKNVGIMIVSTAAPDKAGGVWDFDNVRVQTFGVPSGSFETPAVPTSVPALPMFTDWQHTPKPDWYMEDPQDPRTAWANLAGVFPNPGSSEPGHITNMDGNQAGYIFAVPSNGIFQELETTYEQGVSYKLTAGFVASATIPPADGSTMQMMLYYREGTNSVPVATRDAVYNSANFPSLTSFVDFTAATPFVAKTDPWHGKKIGVMIVATVAASGGIWDVDNVRLTAEVLRVQQSIVGTNLHITFPTASGSTYRLQTSEDLVNWTEVGNSISGTGSEGAIDISIGSAGGQAFYKLKLTTP